jgi:esterase/lipase superfamily enzyme
MTHSGKRLLLLVLVMLTAGCAGSGMMPTPNLYRDPARQPFASVPPQLQNNEATVIYATDRLNVAQKSDRQPPTGPIHYGAGRSMALAIGTCKVRFGKNLTWPALVRESTAPNRLHNPSMTVSEIREAARFAATPYPWELMRNPQYTSQDYEAENARAKQALEKLLALYSPGKTPKEVFVYVHGYNADFTSEADCVAQLWHFFGRQNIPILYTWPAGRGGLLRGYTTDTESGEFTIYHLKEFLLALSACPEVGKIHIIAHSRGTDIVSAALRELNLQLAGAGQDVKSRLKLGQVAMAAPDMDTQVFLQRFIAERVYTIADGFTFYVSTKDRALALSRWLHGGARRLGLIRELKTTPEIDRLLGQFNNLWIIAADVKTDFLGHEFFYTNAAVLSDLILLIRDKRLPGPEQGRPLQKIGPHAWKIVQSYPGK